MNVTEKNGGKELSAVRRIATERDTLATIIRKRLLLLESVLSATLSGRSTGIYPSAVIEASIRARLGKVALGDNGSQAGAESLLEALARQGFLSSLLEWHNHSIRSAAAHVVDILGDLYFGLDPSGVDRAAVQIASLERSAMTTLAYRYMIFGDHSTEERPGVLEFARPAIREGNRPLFLAMHLLEYLFSHRNHDVRWGDLLKLAESYWLDEGMLREAVNLLERGRGFEAEGLIAVYDSPSENAERGPSSVVEIRYAGVFFVQQLSTSLEYVSWCAMYSGRPSVRSALPEVVGRLEDLAIHRNRVKVAIIYASHVLVPGWEQERLRLPVRPNGAELPDRANHQGFGPFVIDIDGKTSFHYVDRVVQMISEQAAHHGADLEVEWVSVLRKLEDDCAVIRNEIR